MHPFVIIIFTCTQQCLMDEYIRIHVAICTIEVFGHVGKLPVVLFLLGICTRVCISTNQMCMVPIFRHTAPSNFPDLANYKYNSILCYKIKNVSILITTDFKL